MRKQILSLLSNTNTYLSGEKISQQLGISRAAVWKNIQALRADGYVIDSVTNRGYCLRTQPDLLSSTAVLAALGPHPWAERLLVLPTVDSTNTYLKKLAAEGAPEGTVVLADAQTGGRGRMGRSFASPAGCGIYLSCLLRPSMPPENLFHLTAMAAVAACDAIQSVCQLRPGIKWTNDLVLGGKKLAGILTELAVEWESNQIDYVVIGIGINCNQQPADFPPEVQEMATSLAQCLGSPVQRCTLAAALVRSFHTMQAAITAEKSLWLQRYAQDCITIGKEILLHKNGTVRRGHADGIDADGSLLVTYDNGERETIFSGEVSVRGLYGYV